MTSPDVGPEFAGRRFARGDFAFDATTTDFGHVRRKDEAVLPITYLGSPAFEPDELTNTIAHEEYHHQNPADRGQGTAGFIGDACAR